MSKYGLKAVTLMSSVIHFLGFTFTLETIIIHPPQLCWHSCSFNSLRDRDLNQFFLSLKTTLFPQIRFKQLLNLLFLGLIGRYNLDFFVIFTEADRMSGDLPLNINIKEPRWDQGTFMGRAQHFFMVTDPRNVLLSSEVLEDARVTVENYRLGIVKPGLTEDELWRAKYIYDSAFHPDTGEKMLLVGRMSAQVPMNMTITGCMLTFYRTTPAVVFWQWVNQSFNAIVNYTNRSGDAAITMNQLGAAYVSATTGAVVTALGLKSLAKHLPPIMGRFVPFAAVAAANCINIPFMRQRELKCGIPVTDAEGKRLGESSKAAQQAIVQVVVSRIGMAVPAMAIPPVIMNALEKKAFMKRFPVLNAPVQVGLVGLCLVFATPLCCALFPQKSSMKVSSLEPELQENIRQSNPNITTVYFNKGL
uniref:Sideroflexin-3 n=1 Tax=Cyprinus carpio TaxID=7962 RepID=A0A8C2G4R8_CYPCA